MIKKTNSVQKFYSMWKDDTNYNPSKLLVIVQSVQNKLSGDDSSDFQNIFRNKLNLQSRNSDGPWLKSHEVNNIANVLSDLIKQTLADELNELNDDF